jgi:sigma-B regulation protein RsbU (phosphoserine phosphatase)
VLANGGQCCPVVLPATGPPRFVLRKLGTALGFEPGLEFDQAELTLCEGDALLLYSDGVIEAFNSQEECYGNVRLLADLGSFSGQTPTALVSGLLGKVRAFANGAPQSDDIAMLVLKVGEQGDHR